MADWERLLALGQEMGRDARDFIVVCMPRSTSTPMARRRNASCARSSKATTVSPTRCKQLGTASAQVQQDTASHGSRRLLLPAHKLSWSASGVPIRRDNWYGLPERFYRGFDRK